MAVFNAIDKIKPAFDWVYKIALFICKLLLVADIIITSFSVAGRYISFIPNPSWTEEIVLTLMAYMAVLSAALAIRRGAHIRMTALDRYLPDALLTALDLLAGICVLILAFVMTIVGMQYALAIGAKGYYVSMPNLSKFWQYLPIPVAGFAMIIFQIEDLYAQIKKIFVKEDNAE